MTSRLPEVVEVVRGLPAERLVLDGETLTMAEDGRPRAFQDTMSRFGADAARIDLLRPFFFDALHVDGLDLVDLPLVDRLVMLERVAGPWRIPSVITSDPGGGRGLRRRARWPKVMRASWSRPRRRATRRAGGARRG